MKIQTPSISRYTLTRPKTKAGHKADYFKILEVMRYGTQISEYTRYNMTMQALREAGLCEAKNREGYVITQKGKAYVAYVNSTTKPIKEVINIILSSPAAFEV